MALTPEEMRQVKAAVRAFREKLSLSQEQFAKMLGYERPTVSRAENTQKLRENGISQNYIDRIEEVFGELPISKELRDKMGNGHRIPYETQSSDGHLGQIPYMSWEAVKTVFDQAEDTVYLTEISYGNSADPVFGCLRKLPKEIKIRVLLLNPKSPFMAARETAANVGEGTFAEQVYENLWECAQLHHDGRDIKIKLYDILPNFPFFFSHALGFRGYYPMGNFSGNVAWEKIAILLDGKTTEQGNALKNEFQLRWASRDAKAVDLAEYYLFHEEEEQVDDE